MALSIRDPKAEELARELARATGETVAEAVKVALAERLVRVRGSGDMNRKERAARLLAHGKAFAALPVLDPRSPDEILGYDEAGLPH